MSPLAHHLSPATCHLPPVTCHLSPVTCHLSPATCHLPPGWHISPLTCCLSPGCHLLPVTCHLSPVTCQAPAGPLTPWPGRALFEEGLALLAASQGDRPQGWRLIQQASEAGHRAATSKLAWALMLGSGLAMDTARAQAMFAALGAQGDPEGQMGLGFLYATGTVVNSSQAQVLQWIQGMEIQ